MEENNELKLYSITTAAKELAIRKETLLDLIEDGKIGVIELGARRKISHIELVRFIKSNSILISPISKNNKISIDTIVKKHKYSNKEKSIDKINKVFNKLKRRI